MIFEKLILHNWIPYRGTNEIIFSTEENKKITLIRGSNKGGKTAIIRALKWVLYEDTGDLTEYKNPFDILNREAKKESDFNLEVSLELSKNGKDQNSKIT